MKKIITLTPKQTHEKLQNDKNVLFLDVRSYAENKFVGRALSSILLPWLDEPDWEPDPQGFINAVKKYTNKNDKTLATEIILICRSGYRSHDAGKCLIEHGFTNVSHVISGFEGDLDENDQRGNLNGWRHDNMPWEQC